MGKIKIPEQTHMYVDNWFLDRGSQQFSGERIVFNKWCLDVHMQQTGIQPEQQILILTFHPRQKLTQHEPQTYMENESYKLSRRKRGKAIFMALDVEKISQI